MALTAATQEAVFLRQLLQEMGQPPATVTLIHEDNQSCIAPVQEHHDHWQEQAHRGEDVLLS